MLYSIKKIFFWCKQYSLDKFNDLNGGILKEFIILENNLISFKIQNGVISENGINGIQASDLIKINMFESNHFLYLY